MNLACSRIKQKKESPEDAGASRRRVFGDLPRKSPKKEARWSEECLRETLAKFGKGFQKEELTVMPKRVGTIGDGPEVNCCSLVAVVGFVSQGVACGVSTRVV